MRNGWDCGLLRSGNLFQCSGITGRSTCEEESPQHHNTHHKRQGHKDGWSAQRLPQSAGVPLIDLVGFNAWLYTVVKLPYGRIVLASFRSDRLILACPGGCIEPHRVPLIRPQSIELRIRVLLCHTADDQTMQVFAVLRDDHHVQADMAVLGEEIGGALR